MKKRKLIFFVVVLFLVGGLSLYHVSSKQTKRAFIDAVVKGDLAKVQNILTKNPRLISLRDRRFGSGSKVLYLAIRSGRKDIAKLLLLMGANPNEMSYEKAYEQTPLHRAAINGDAELIELLIKHGANINATENLDFQTPLFYARNKEAAEKLIEHGADISWRDEYGNTALHRIAKAGVIEAVEVLLEQGADIHAKNKSGLTPLHKARNREMIEYLLSRGADIEAGGRYNTPLRHAMEIHSKEAAICLISHGAKHRISDVAYLGDLERVREFIESDPNLVNYVNGSNEEPVLLKAISGGHRDVAEFLLNNGAKIESVKCKHPVLHIAAYKGHKDVVELLLEKGMYVNQKGPHGELALHWAAAKGHLDVVEALLKAGANVNTRTEKQRVSMDTMSKNEIDPIDSQLKLIELLEKQRRNQYLQIAPPHRVAFAAGDTALHSAAQWGHEDVVKLLLEKGADVNIANRWGETSLHYGTIFRHKDVVKMLIEADADINAKDKKGRTARWLARSPRGTSNTEITELLTSK